MGNRKKLLNVGGVRESCHINLIYDASLNVCRDVDAVNVLMMGEKKKVNGILWRKIVRLFFYWPATIFRK